MANTKVEGSIIGSDSKPLQGLTVEAFDVEAIFDNVSLGTTRTDDTGGFTIEYGSWSFGLELRPDIKIQVSNSFKRLLYESEVFPDVSDPTLVVPPITIPLADLHGFLVTQRTGIPLALSHNNFVEPLIDNEKAWKELTEAVRNATQSIYMQLLYFDIKQLITIFKKPAQGSYSEEDLLEKRLLEANRERNVEVRILVNDFMFFPYPTDTADQVISYFEEERLNKPHTIEIRTFRRPLRTPMHAKFIIIDNAKAYLVGSPLLQEYFDGSSHSVDDPRRGSMVFLKNSIRVPVHDVGLSIEGAALDNLQQTFFLHWNQAGTPVPTVFSHRTPSTSNATTQIVRTLPGDVFSSIPNGETGILEAYQRAFAEAKEFIYLENQYLTEDAIIDSLLCALDKNRELQVIMLINNKVDIPLYQCWQTSLIRRFRAGLPAIQANKRVGIFTLWSHDATSSPSRIIRNYVHSKVAIVDDKWATVGSANLDGVSLIMSQHILRPYTSADKLERSTEVNALIFNAAHDFSADIDLPASTVPATLRKILWAEHLGYNSPDHKDLIQKPEQKPDLGGWLSLWKDRAEMKFQNIAKSPPEWHEARILPWPPQAQKKADQYLLELARARGLTVDTSKLTIQEEIHSFNFKTGDWRSKWSSPDTDGTHMFP